VPFIGFSISSKEVATVTVQSKPDLEGFYEKCNFTLPSWRVQNLR